MIVLLYIYRAILWLVGVITNECCYFHIGQSQNEVLGSRDFVLLKNSKESIKCLLLNSEHVILANRKSKVMFLKEVSYIMPSVKEISIYTRFGVVKHINERKLIKLKERYELD